MSTVEGRLQAFSAGTLPWDELLAWAASYRWPAAPVASEPEGDPEPVPEGSFDEVTTAWILGDLDDDQYRQLVAAARDSQPPGLTGVKLEWRPELHPRDRRGQFSDNPAATLGDMLRHTPSRGGMSWQPHTGRAPRRGYMVAMTGHTKQLPESILEDPDEAAAAVVDYLDANEEVFRGSPNVYLGGWIEDGKFWLEPSENIADREEAMRVGRERDQIAIYDVATGEFPDTGGAGGFLDSS